LDCRLKDVYGGAGYQRCKDRDREKGEPHC
jgi:hypothetical protein